MISFCTVCCNRLHHFEQVFKWNDQKLNGRAQWVILDFNSTDGLSEFMQPRLRPGIVFARETSGRPFHASICKNIAHRLATGDYLMNLDTDTFVDHDIALIEFSIAKGFHGVIRGRAGRIGMHAFVFYGLGGYDESMMPFTWQDNDLVDRVRRANLGVLAAPGYRCLTHDRSDSLKEIRNGLSYEEMSKANEKIYFNNRRESKTVVNQGVKWGHSDDLTVSSG